MMTFWLIFLSRLIYLFASKAHVWILYITVDANNNKSFGVYVFVLLIIWEIFPTTMILWCFRSIPATNVGGCSCWFWSNANYLDDYSSDVRYKSKAKPLWDTGKTQNR